MKKATRIRNDLDRCRFRGDVSKCAACQQKPERVRDEWGREYSVMTVCQLYAHAGMGPTNRRRRILIFVLSGLAGLAVPLIARLLT